MSKSFNGGNLDVIHLRVAHLTASSKTKMTVERNYQTTENLHGWNMRPRANAFRTPDINSVHFLQSGAAMQTNQYERGYPHGDLLNSEAQAVIDADFREITTDHKPRSFMQLLKDMFQWIKKRLQRA